ncbi:ThiF family protein [Micromonospora rhizosphaerae]|uniref:ThiF family protein n=1 Tax=Micromonospora rhizosphaerae TaxID=568872 RepID=A0A1C6RDW9_9ACTN|nr:ThiF family adenylyltransferase [Micromonospora rhizosphaerae]SCL15254.1 ThiF family protein [Micromonospora rhizosphaerae]
MTRSVVDQDVTSPRAARALPPEEFHQIFVARNRGVVSTEDQARIAAAKILVAGCGSIGGSAVEPLVRLGFRRLVLADPGSYELTNLNRQNATVDDLGRNKAAVAAERARAINPHVEVEPVEQGVTEQTVDGLLAGVDVVIDGVDVTTRSGLAAKGLLHDRVRDRRLPLMTGWDLSGTQHVRVYDYRHERQLFGGAVTRQQLNEMPMWTLLARLVPARTVPRDLIGLIRRGLEQDGFTFPQLVQAADMFGVIAATLTARLVTGRPVPPSATVDVHGLTAPLHQRLRDRVRQPLEVASLLLDVTRASRRER